MDYTNGNLVKNMMYSNQPPSVLDPNNATLVRNIGESGGLSITDFTYDNTTKELTLMLTSGPMVVSLKPLSDELQLQIDTIVNGGIVTDVVDNGDGTLTFNKNDGTSLTINFSGGVTEEDPIFMAEKPNIAGKTTKTAHTINFNNLDGTSEAIDVNKLFYQGTNLIEVIANDNNVIFKKNNVNMFIFGESGGYFQNTNTENKLVVQSEIANFLPKDGATDIPLETTFANSAVSFIMGTDAFVVRNVVSGITNRMLVAPTSTVIASPDNINKMTVSNSGSSITWDGKNRFYAREVDTQIAGPDPTLTNLKISEDSIVLLTEGKNRIYADITQSVLRSPSATQGMEVRDSGAYIRGARLKHENTTNPNANYIIKQDLLDMYYENTTPTTPITLDNTYKTITAITTTQDLFARLYLLGIVQRDSAGSPLIGALSIRVSDGTNTYEAGFEVFRDMTASKHFVTPTRLNFLTGTVTISAQYVGPGTVTLSAVTASLE